MPYRAVLFDVGDTLWHSPEAPPAAEFRRIAAVRALEYLGSVGIEHEDPAMVARVAWDAIEEASNGAKTADLVEPDYAAAARAALEPVGLHLSREQAAELTEAIYISGEDGGKVAYPDAVETLKELMARGFRLGIVTNRGFGGRRFREDLASAGLDVGWDAIIVSVEVGYLKPHPAIFEAALDALQVQAAEAVMVGNSLAQDIAGAQQMGIAAAWRRWAPDAEGVIPDCSFDELHELLEWPALKAASS